MEYSTGQPHTKYINNFTSGLFMRKSRIANHAFDQGDRTAKKIIYGCMGMEPNTYCMSNHKQLLKKEKAEPKTHKRYTYFS